MFEQARQVRELLSPQKPSGQTFKQIDPSRNVFSEQAMHSLEDDLYLVQVELHARQTLKSESSKKNFNLFYIKTNSISDIFNPKSHQDRSLHM